MPRHAPRLVAGMPWGEEGGRRRKKEEEGDKGVTHGFGEQE